MFDRHFNRVFLHQHAPLGFFFSQRSVCSSLFVFVSIYPSLDELTAVRLTLEAGGWKTWIVEALYQESVCQYD